MHAFGPIIAVTDVKLVVSMTWTQATPWVSLGFTHTLYSREPADGFATRVWVTCTHVFVDE